MKTTTLTLCLLSLSFSLAEAAEHLVPEDFPTIQEAIDASAPGDLVVVKEGTWKERLRLKAGVTVRSSGDDTRTEAGTLVRSAKTILDGSGAPDDSPGVRMAKNSTLDGFTITRIGTFDEDRWKKDWDERGEQQSYEHIGTISVPAVLIEGVDCTVRNNVVHDNGDTGIAIRGAGGTALVEHNHCFRNMGGGIGCMNGASAIIRKNTCYENLFAGIGHDAASPLVEENTCYGNVRAGIGISEGSCPIVRKNLCYENRRSGIGIRTGEATRPIVENNECHGNGMSGIGIEKLASPIIRGNRCFQNRMAGIGTRKGAKPVLVENHCFENKASGIGSDDAEPLILHNQVERNGSAGIGIRGESLAIAIGNTCTDNRAVAVGIPNGGKAILLSNRLARSEGKAPMVAILGGATATLSGNTIEGGGVAAIMLDGSLSLVDNTLTGKGSGTGLVSREGSEAFLVGNRFDGFARNLIGTGIESLPEAGEKPE